MCMLSISYNRLWKLLVDKNMSRADLRRAVSLTVLRKICTCLQCNVGDICDFVADPHAAT